MEEKILEIRPDIVFHMAAQPLVIESFKKPLDTLHTNIIGTANLMEASRNIKSLKIQSVKNIKINLLFDKKTSLIKKNELEKLRKNLS